MSVELEQLRGVTETIHGIEVYDPYRWLEDRGSAATQQWIAQQRSHFESYIGELGSLDHLRERVREYVDVETTDEAGKVGPRYFFRRRRTGEQQPSIYVMDSDDRPPRVLVDQSTADPYEAVSILRISQDGNLLAYHVKHGGEHSRAIYVVDVTTGITLLDHLRPGLARGFVFSTKNDGFFYCHEFSDDQTLHERDHEVLFHRFGNTESTDPVILSLPRGQSSKVVLLHDDAMLGALYGYHLNGSHVMDLYMFTQGNDHVWKQICYQVEGPFSPFFYRNRLFAFQFRHSPNGELVELDIVTGKQKRVIIPEWRTRIRQCIIVADRFYVSYPEGSETRVQIWSVNGEDLGVLPLEEGYTWGLVPKYSNEAEEYFLHCESFTRPPTLFLCHAYSDQRVVWNQQTTARINVARFAHKVKFRSKDNIEVAMSLVGQDDLAQLKNRRTIMTGYGGFGAPTSPLFSPFVSIMLDLGFLFALPEIRGGGEGGEAWHQAGRGQNRQVSIDDFIAAAEWLNDTGVAISEGLAAFGGSHSALLIGTTIMQRPSLFRAALCIVPILDMIRYHLFDRARVWADEYGTAEDPTDFQSLFATSPYHNVREGTNYPSVLFVCGDKDTRCNPLHARKTAARLSANPAQRNPILIDDAPERGHSPTMPLAVRIEGITRRIAFLCHELGVKFPQEAQDDCSCR